MSKILITGVSGLIGGTIYEALFLDKNVELTGIYNKSAPSSLSGKLLRVDLSKDCAAIDATRYSFLIHCSALIPGERFSDETCYSINRDIDDNILKMAQLNPEMKIIYISSVYLTESSKLNSSKYLQGKKETEDKFLDLPNPVFILRISSPYGILSKNKNVLNLFVDKSIKNEDIFYFGSGERSQDFIAADDITEAVLKCLQNFSANTKQILNIVSGSSISMKNLAKLTIELNRNSKSKLLSNNITDPEENYRASFFSNAFEIIGWKPNISIEKGLKQLIESRKNENSFSF